MNREHIELIACDSGSYSEGTRLDLRLSLPKDAQGRYRQAQLTVLFRADGKVDVLVDPFEFRPGSVKTYSYPKE